MSELRRRIAQALNPKYDTFEEDMNTLKGKKIKSKELFKDPRLGEEFVYPEGHALAGQKGIHGIGMTLEESIESDKDFKEKTKEAMLEKFQKAVQDNDYETASSILQAAKQEDELKDLMTKDFSTRAAALDFGADPAGYSFEQSPAFRKEKKSPIDELVEGEKAIQKQRLLGEKLVSEKARAKTNKDIKLGELKLRTLLARIRQAGDLDKLSSNKKRLLAETIMDELELTKEGSPEERELKKQLKAVKESMLK